MQKNHIISYKKQSIRLLIKKNKLSRNYKLTFDKKNLRGLVSIPYYVSFKSGLDFANENIEWLYKEIKKFLPLVLIRNNLSLLIMGKKMQIIFEEDILNKILVQKNNIIIKSHNNSHEKMLKKWLVNQILMHSKNYVDTVSKSLRLNIKELKISNSFNYWGSCNSAGVIHLNWRLIFAPIQVLEYIIVHELCHLKEFNHTKNFWMLVKKFCPDYKNQILWLKKNDIYLYRIRFN
jgi:predicted metal-dependent hydrolase